MDNDNWVMEFRWHGRGGQGVITAGKLLAEAAMEEGKYFQALPDYGAERMGAPIKAYTRISPQPLVLHCQVTYPDVVVVADSTLLGVVDVTEGLKEDGALVVNTKLSPDAIRKRLGYTRGRVYTIDATGIALDTIGRNIPNSPMLGALIKATKIVDKDSMAHKMESKFAAIFRPAVVAGNLKALERALEETQVG